MRVRVPPPASVHPLLTIADELERRDARVAAELARVEALQAQVEALRADAATTFDALGWLPRTIADNARALAEAERAQQIAVQKLSAAEQGKDRDEPAVDRARSDVAVAERDVARLREHEEQLDRDLAALHERASELRQRAAELSEQIPAAGVPGDLLVWASQARGVLLVERSGLARERESIVREASELLGSVLVDPLAATSVAGLRERLERALP
jgi:chromosome segregation ATPase